MRLVAAATVTLLMLISACDDAGRTGPGANRPRVGVILPSATRWIAAYPSYFKAAFAAAGVAAEISDAQGSGETFERIAQRMIDSGVRAGPRRSRSGDAD